VSPEINALVERFQPLDDKFVTKLRKDFLTLTRNIKRLRSYRDTERVRSAIVIWRKRLRTFLLQITRELEGRIRTSEHGFYRGADKPKGYPNKDWAEYYLKKLSVVWTLLSEMNSFPHEPWPLLKKYGHRPYSYGAPTTDAEWQEKVFQSEKEPMRKWVQRVRKKATPAWKLLKELSKWAEEEGRRGGGGEAVLVNPRRRENVRISGFAVQTIGYDERDEMHRESLEKLKAAFKIYRARASKVYPWLLQHQLPFEANFATDPNRGGSMYAATYEQDHIALSPLGMALAKPRGLAKTLAHEMGHHIFQTALSEEARKVWTQFIRGNYTRLDLRDVALLRKPGERSSAFMDRIDRDYPIISIQLDAMEYSDKDAYAEFMGLTRIQDYLDKGNPPVVRVPTIPITGYASKNPEEAFCETLGLLVGYGPRTLNRRVVKLMQSLVGNVKLESVRSLTQQLREYDMPVRWNV
jgi:hypothetical protein